MGKKDLDNIDIEFIGFSKDDVTNHIKEFILQKVVFETDIERIKTLFSQYTRNRNFNIELIDGWHIKVIKE